MSSFKEQLLEAQSNAKLSRHEDTISERATMFLRSFIIPKLKNGCTYLSFTYDCENGLHYISDAGIKLQSCDIFVAVSVLREAVRIARTISNDIDAEVKIDKMQGVNYCFTSKFGKSNNSEQAKKTVSFFEDFLKPKFIKIVALLPEEKELFCTILLSKNKEAHYVSNIDTCKCFIKNYRVEQIFEAIKVARKEGITVDEKEINDNTKAIIFSISLQ